MAAGGTCHPPSLTRTPSLSQKPDQAELLSLSNPPSGSLVAQMIKNLPAIEETQVRSPGGGNGNPLQCSCPENPLDRGDWWATVHSVAKSCTRLKRLTLVL